VILLALGCAGYVIYSFAGDQIRTFVEGLLGQSSAPEKPAHKATPAPDAGPTPAKTATGPAPAGAPNHPAPPSPPPAPTVAAPPAKSAPILAVPPLLHATGLHDALSANSEQEAIRLLLEGKAAIAITSVAALAAVPEDQLSQLRAVRLLGFWPAEAALGPTCDLAKLSANIRLGAVRGSLAHYEMLRLTQGLKTRPDIALFDDEASLASAYATSRVSGELPLGLREAVNLSGCDTLPRSDFAFVAVERADHPVPAEDLTRALGTIPDATAEQIQAFAHKGSGSFAEVFDRAGKTWLAAQIVSKAPTLPENLNALAPASLVDAGVATPDAGPLAVADGGMAVDAGTATATSPDAGLLAAAPADAGVAPLKQVPPPKVPATTAKPAPPQPISRELGFPSWIDR
jgi:hypothetical protein